MGKGQDAKKAVKKEVTKTLKEKRAEKKLKKAGKKDQFLLNYRILSIKKAGIYNSCFFYTYFF